MTIPLITINSSGVTVPSESDVLAGTVDTFKTVFGANLNLDVNNPSTLATPHGQLCQAVAYIVSRVYDVFGFVLNQFNPRYAVGRFQDGLAYINGITRKPATATVVSLTCYGLDGTNIISGTTKASDIYGRTYTCIESGTIAGGVVTVDFACDVLGAIASPANTVNRIDLTVIGLDRVNNLTAGVTGENVETQSEMEARRYLSVGALGHSSVSAIYGRVFAVAGVTDLWVDENYTNVNYPKRGVTLIPHSILVCVVGGTDNDIAQAIIDSKSAGADMNGDVTVVIGNETAIFYRATPITLSVRVKVTSSPLLPTNTTDTIKQLVVDSANGLNGQKRISIGERVVANRFTAYVQTNLPNIELQDIDVSLNGGTSWHDLVLVNGNQIVVIDTTNVSVSYV